MAAEKFLKNVAGNITESVAVVTSAGAGDDGKVVGLDTNGRLTESVMSAALVSTSAGAGDSGKIVKLAGTGKIDDTIMSRVPVASSAGAGDAAKLPVLDGAGRLDSTFMPVGIGADTASIVSSENLAAGDLVNVWDDSGTPKVRKADASNGREADGFVLAGVTSPAAATVYFEGTITGLSGLTGGQMRFLSGASAGLSTATAPTTAGHVVQKVGRALTATTLSFEPQQGITLA